jgi:hypothetical protein
MWRECIKKVWEVDPLICPKCTAEMKIFEEKKTQRAPPKAQIDYTERVKIVPYDDGWPVYEEAVFDF